MINKKLYNINQYNAPFKINILILNGWCFLHVSKPRFHLQEDGFRARSEPGGTRWPTGGEVKGKLANGVGSQYSHATSVRGLSIITTADAHTSAASSRLNWHPHRFRWTRPFQGKTKSGFCACAITFRTIYTYSYVIKYIKKLGFFVLTNIQQSIMRKKWLVSRDSDGAKLS